MFQLLIVDDDPDDRDILQTALEQAGIERILAVSSAQEVFFYLQGVKCREELPKVIITDLNMPEIDGCNLINVLRTMDHYQQISVVVCSTSSRPRDVTKCLAAGACQFITKPNNLEEFRKISNQIKQYVSD